jgi:hypothetical protein
MGMAKPRSGGKGKLKLGNYDEAQAQIASEASRASTSRVHLKEPFLKAYQELENETLACQKVGIPDSSLISYWKSHDEQFLKAFTTAHHKAQRKHNDLLRTSMIQRAIKGTPHYLIKGGEYVRDEKGERVVAWYDQEPQLTMFVAKNRMPDEFRDKFEHEITGKLIQMLV